MKTWYSKPPTSRMRLPSDSPKTTTNSSEDTTGATTVWLQSRITRSASRAASQNRLR